MYSYNIVYEQQHLNNNHTNQYEISMIVYSIKNLIQTSKSKERMGIKQSIDH